MGSLASRPKAPTQPQVVYIPQPVTSAPVATPAPTPVSTPDPVETGASDVPDTTEEARTQNLLSRDRSRFGTVQTSFRGLLSAAAQPQRKTLLGE